MGPYHRILVESLAKDGGVGYPKPRPGRFDPLRHLATLDLLDALDRCATSDDAATAMEGAVGAIRRQAESDRAAPEWENLALLAGWISTAATKVWDFPTYEAVPQPVPPARSTPMEWTPLAEPYSSERGFAVEFASSTDDLARYGYALNNALRTDGYRQRYAERIATGLEHVYAVTRDGIVYSNGEILPRHESFALEWNRGEANGRPDPRSDVAIEVFLEAVRKREVEVAYEVVDGRFALVEPRPAGP